MHDDDTSVEPEGFCLDDLHRAAAHSQKKRDLVLVRHTELSLATLRERRKGYHSDLGGPVFNGDHDVKAPRRVDPTCAEAGSVAHHRLAPAAHTAHGSLNKVIRSIHRYMHTVTTATTAQQTLASGAALL
jgi:hypothetical protein